MKDKQTAIEWAEDKLSDLNSAVVNGEIAPKEYHEIRVNIWKKAKEMEKEQIKDAYLESSKQTCWSYGEDPPSDDNVYAEEYYNETYAHDTIKGLPEENSKRRAWHR